MLFIAELSNNGTSLKFEKDENSKLNIRLLDDVDTMYGDFGTYKYNKIIEALNNLECTDNELKAFTSYIKNQVFDESILQFKMNDSMIDIAKNKLETILYNKRKLNLTPDEKFILINPDKDIINNDEYVCLPTIIQDIYSPIYNDTYDKKNILFVLDFIKNHKNFVDNITFNTNIIGTNSIGKHNIKFKLHRCDDAFYFDISKTIDNIFGYEPFKINAVHLSELLDNFDDFPEDVYTSNLKYNLLQDIKVNTINSYQHKQSISRLYYLNNLRKKAETEIIYTGVNPLTPEQIKELSEPNVIITDSKTSPENYIFNKRILKLDETYAKILNDAQPNLIGIDDVIRLIKKLM